MVNSDLCQINRPYFGREIAFHLERDHAYLRLFWSLDETCPSGTNVPFMVYCISIVYEKVVSLYRIYAIDHEWYISSAGTMFIL